MGSKDDKVANAGLNLFKRNLDDLNISIKEKDIWQGIGDLKQTNLKNLARDLVENNLKKFSFILDSHKDISPQHQIEKIYSRNEIKKMVCDHLITDYQHEKIINAVTDYLYGIHVSH